MYFCYEQDYRSRQMAGRSALGECIDYFVVPNLLIQNHNHCVAVTTLGRKLLLIFHGKHVDLSFLLISAL